MEWLETTIETTSEGVEIVTGALMSLGISGLQIDDAAELQNFLSSTTTKYWDYVDDDLLAHNTPGVLITCYLNNNLLGQELLLSVKSTLAQLKNMPLGFDLGTLEVAVKNVDDEDWINNWKKYYKTFALGEKIVIKPLWETYENTENKVVFTIDPGHVFGTGLHQTTQLCILQLEKYVDQTATVLDLGCGSGILSIISLLLGARSAVAVDIDPNAVDTAYKNAALNDIGRTNYHVFSGDLLLDEPLRAQITQTKYPIVVANIVADVIIGLTDFVLEVLAEDGVFICSGIITERVDDVTQALLEKCYEIISVNEKDGWNSIVSKPMTDKKVR